MKMLMTSKGQNPQVFGFVLITVLLILIISKLIVGGNFSGATGTIMDILPIALAGLAVYFLVFTFNR